MSLGLQVPTLLNMHSSASVKTEDLLDSVEKNGNRVWVWQCVECSPSTAFIRKTRVQVPMKLHQQSFSKLHPGFWNFMRCKLLQEDDLREGCESWRGMWRGEFGFYREGNNIKMLFLKAWLAINWNNLVEKSQQQLTTDIRVKTKPDKACASTTADNHSGSFPVIWLPIISSHPSLKL